MAFFKTQKEFNKTFWNPKKSPKMEAFWKGQDAKKAKGKAKQDKIVKYAKSFTKASNKVYGTLTGNIGSKLGKAFKKK